MRPGIDIWDYKHLDMLSPPVIADFCVPNNHVNTKLRKKLSSDLRKLAKELGRTPTVRECNSCLYTQNLYSYTKEFGTWGKALEAAGLKLKTDKDEMLSSLQRLTDELGHFPTEEQCNWCEYTPCYRTYLRKFGPWDEIKKMIKT